MLYVSRVFVTKSATDAGIASAGNTKVGVAGRFPGSFLNGESVTVALKAAKTQAIGNLPAGSLLAVINPALTTLAQAATAAATQITVTSPVSATLPISVLVDSEIMTVTAVDATKTKLTVTRGATPAAHASGAMVLAPVGSLAAGGIDAASTRLPWPQPLTGAPPSTIQAGTEQMAVTAIDSTNTKLTVTRGLNGSTPAAHAAGDPVCSPVLSATLYANGASGPFMGGGNPLPSPTPPGLYVLTVQVTRPGCSRARRWYTTASVWIPLIRAISESYWARLRRGISMPCKTRWRSRPGAA